MSTIIGQEKLLAFFDNAIKGNKLAHAYVIAGPAQVGKRTLTRQVAAQILDIPETKLETNPDFVMFGRLVDDKTGKTKKDISVAQARTIRESLINRSWSGGNRVVVIDEAEHLNIEAGNALLKMLEEPLEKTVVFLLVENEKMLLPTILSRTQVLYCCLVSEIRIMDWLVRLGAEKKVAAEIAAFSWGRPGRAQTLFTNLDFLNECRETAKLWHDLQRQPFFVQSKAVEKFLNALEDIPDSRDRIKETLTLWLMEERKKMRLSFDASQINLMDTLSRGRELIEKNITPRLVLETAFLSH